MKPLSRFVCLFHSLCLIVASHSFGQTNIFRPEIVAQTPLSLTTVQNQPITIELTNLVVIDGDPSPVYPNGYTLEVLDGKNYEVNNTTVIPDRNFRGRLKVQVTVNDGRFTSRKFEVKISVDEAANVPPEIVGQDLLETDEDKSFTLRLSHLDVNDPDDNYPNNFQLIIADGPDYTVSGQQVTPTRNFYGDLHVSVVVNDGESNSAPYNVTLQVNPVNDAPIITGQTSLTTSQNTAITIVPGNLSVTDPDDKYPDDFSFKLQAGPNYSVSVNKVTPATNFSGILNVKLSVHDGALESNIFTLRIEVSAAPSNVPPTITSQKVISIVESSPLPIQLSHVLVNDPDDEFPVGFSLKVFPGDDYTLNGTTITPVPNFKNRTLSVKITVNDGISDSAPFMLKVEVTPISATPKINGQKELTTKEETSIGISLTDLEVTDSDNAGYPKGFSLTVMPGDPKLFKVDGNIVTPAADINNFIDVTVKVSDGVNVSAPFKVSIMVTPINDAPQIITFDSTRLTFEPGKDAIDLFETFDLRDVDSDHLSMAEVGFKTPHYSQGNDELKITVDSTAAINAIFDPNGILFLVGYATLEEYRTVIRSIQYEYHITFDENGNPLEIPSSARTVYVKLHDGQSLSESRERKIQMQTKVHLDIPNTFTPNGDKANDTWKIRASNIEQLGDAIIRVYNKQGLLVFEAIGIEKEWDGVFGGEVVPVDTYYYTIDLNLAYVKQTYKGAVTIMH